MGDTAISWTDKTWNVIRGCRRVSEGCRNCYAERTARRFGGKGKPYEGLVETRLHVISDDEQRLEPRWTGEIQFVDEHLTDPMRWGKPAMVFVNSMSDMFFEKLTNEQIAAVYGVMAACPRHTFQVLTKRSERMREWFKWVSADAVKHGIGVAHRCYIELANRVPWFRDYRPRTLSYAGDFWERTAKGRNWPLENVWQGVSVESQKHIDRIESLLATPAAIRFISAEPLLGELDLTCVGQWRGQPMSALEEQVGHVERPRLDWVIAGCESGPYRRKADYRWFQSLRDQCRDAGVAFFLKQAECTLEHEVPGGIPGAFGYGTRPPSFAVRGGDGSKKKGGGIFELPYLDGVQHKAFPNVPR